MASTGSSVETQHGLKKELRLRDLVLAQILFVTGFSNLGTAAKLGPYHVVFWLLAMVLFYIPQAMVVVELNQWRPLEGGLYQWAKAAFGEMTGFLVAWNLWLYAMALMSENGLTTTTSLAYSLGPGAAWMADSKWFIIAASALVVAGLVVVSILGLSVGKWVYNAGGALVLFVFVALLAVPFVGHEPHPVALALPKFSLLNLNILGKLSFFALGGFEYVAVFAGECRDPQRTIRRSVIISAPIIAAFFILGTNAVLSVVSPKDVDLVSPVVQALSVAARPFGIAARVVAMMFLLQVGVKVAQASINFAVNSRLPMVAGWDNLLPAFFTRLHPKFKTPVNSVLFVGAVTFALSVAGIAGVDRQEAFQLLNNASGIFYGLTYLAMFAIPIAGFAGASLKLRAAALSGFAMTLLCVVLSIFPIIDVPNPLSFTVKLGGLIIGANLLGAAIFQLARRR